MFQRPKPLPWVKLKLRKTVVVLLGTSTLMGFGAGLVFGYLGHEPAPETTVGLYSCSDNLSVCTRLRWVPGVFKCAAARDEYRTAPVVGPVLVCIPRTAFIME